MIDPEKIRVTQIQAGIRGILDALNVSRPIPLSYESICSIFLTVEEHYIRRDLDYLMEKDYVEWVNERPNAPWRGRMFKLTGSGIEIALKMITDPALEA